MSTNLEAGWEVEWCMAIPVDELGEADMDSAKYRRRLFSSKEEAMKYAKTAAPLAVFKVALVTEFEVNEYGDFTYLGEQEGVEIS